MQGFFLGFTWIHLDCLGMNSRAGCIRELSPRRDVLRAGIQSALIRRWQLSDTAGMIAAAR
jgi:hypothetical protein